MRNDKELKKRIKDDPDYIYNPKMGNSLTKMITRYPDGIEDKKIAKVLLMSVEDINKIYAKIIKGIREKLNLGEGE